MKNKSQRRLVTLTILFIICALIYVINDKYTTLFPAKSEVIFSNAKPDQITELFFTKESSTEAVYKKNNQWYSRKGSVEYKADTERINSIVDTIMHLTKDDVVSNNADKHANFGIGKEKITLKGLSKTHTLYIGKQVSSKNYLVLDNESEVFTSDGLVDVFVPFEYRDMKLPLVTDENKVTNVKVSGSVNLELAKKNSDWFINNQKAKKDRVDFYINDLKTIKADDLLAVDTSSLSPSMTITVTENGKQTTADFYEKEADHFYVKIQGIKYMHQVQVVYIQSLKKDPTDFIQ